jgi:DNA-directed RNA polymerase specialized sigma24 family protein
MALTPEQQRRLVDEARDGAPAARAAAHRALLADLRPFAMAVIHRALAAAGVGHEHAEEAFVQTSFRIFTTGLARYAGDAAPRSYFLRIALNCAIDVVRAVLRPPPPAEAGPADPAPDPLAARLAAEEHERAVEALAACLAVLPPDCADAVRLYYLEEAGTCAACAAVVGVAPLAFMKRLERARARLARCVRGRLAERPGHGSPRAAPLGGRDG